MKIHLHFGNLLDYYNLNVVSAIAHGCNCYHTMGSGIAPLINDLTHGDALAADKTSAYGDESKLGDFTVVESEDRPWVYNLYTQGGFGKGGPPNIVWEAFREALAAAISDVPKEKQIDGQTFIAIPLIGCGLGGGRVEDFVRVVKDLQTVYDDRVTLVIVCNELKHEIFYNKELTEELDEHRF